MAEQAAKSKKNLSLLHYTITLAIMLMVGMIPPAEPITVLGMKVVGVFAGMVYGWSTLGLIFPSLLGLCIFAVSGSIPINQLFMEGFGNNVVVLLIFIFIFAAAITEAGIGEFIATWLITRRAMLGRPWLLTAIFFLAAFLTSAAVNSFGSMIICWGILYDLCKKSVINLEKPGQPLWSLGSLSAPFWAQAPLLLKPSPCWSSVCMKKSAVPPLIFWLSALFFGRFPSWS